MKYVVCFSGGHSSAIAAIETVRRYGKENVILLNHNLSPEVEDADIKRFKREIAEYLGLEITYANIDNWETMTPLKVCRELGGFKFGNSPILCTYNLKTKPFYKWLNDNYPVRKGEIREDVTIVYGFDASEPNRINRRVGIMAAQGYKTEYPLAYGERTIQDTEDIGIKRPNTYDLFKHANCKGCLKAGRQQWYLTFCLYPEIWEEAKETEEEIGYSIMKDIFLKDLEPKFKQMKCMGIEPTEKMNPAKFWSMVRKNLPETEQLTLFPCECSL